jgi:hypothetical protein
MSKGERLERAALVLIVVAVGALAARVSFSHVVQWSMQNLPAGASVWDARTNAVVSELLPVGALLFIRHQRRNGHKPGWLAWLALIGACLFSLTAQIAVAVPSISGWVIASVPTLAFMILTKLSLNMRPVTPVTPPASLATRTRTKPAPVPGTRPSSAPGVSAPPKAATGPQEEPAASGRSQATPKPPRKRVTAKSLTNADKVIAAAEELGRKAPVKLIADKAGVSASTVRRHLQPKTASSSSESPAETPPGSDARQLTAAGAT